MYQRRKCTCPYSERGLSSCIKFMNHYLYPLYKNLVGAIDRTLDFYSGGTWIETAQCRKFFSIFDSALIITALHAFYINSHFDWIRCNRTQGVCASVCVSVCLSVSSLQPKRLNRFWWNFPQMILSIFASVIFRGQFLKFRIRWRNSGHFALTRCGTLTVAILVRFFSNFNTRST